MAPANGWAVDLRPRRTMIPDIGWAIRPISGDIQVNPAGEIGGDRSVDRSLGAGAEGATAPETLRQTDRGGMKLWKAGGRESGRLTEGVNRACPASLSGSTTEGATTGPV